MALPGHGLPLVKVMEYIPLPLYDPRYVPSIRTAVKRLSLKPGEIAMGQNIRTDTDSLIARIGDLTLNASAPTGSTGACMGSWAGFLNGTAYMLSAWVMSAGGVAVFNQNLTNGTYSEITSAGAATVPTWGGSVTGKTRFTTETGQVVFSACTTPRRVYAGTAVDPIDVLVIQNGEDYPAIYNPTLTAAIAYLWHQPITVPAGAQNFRVLATLANYWAIWGTTRPTYASGGVLNQGTHFALLDSTATYTGSNVVVKLQLAGSVASGDIATMKFTTGATFSGGYLCIVFEGTSANINFILKDSKIELGKENVAYASVSTWSTIFDPSSSDLNLKQMPPLIPLDAGATRWMMQIPLQNIAALANRTAYHIRFTRINATVPGSTKTVMILAIGSTGSGGGFNYGTEWSVVYADRYGFAESPPYVQSASDTDYLYNIGGPRGPDAATETPITLPKDATALYDYRLLVKNTDTGSGASFYGGLNGEASNIDVYFRNPATEDTAYLFGSWGMWTPNADGGGDYWSNVAGSTSNITLKTEVAHVAGVTDYGCGNGSFAIIDRFSRDPGVPVPSDFNLPIPKAACIHSANGRLFAGRLKSTGGTYSKSTLRFSDHGFFSRFVSANIDLAPNRGGTVTFPGEEVKAIHSAAAAAQGASKVFVWTDQTFNFLGVNSNSAFVGSGFDGIELTRRSRNSSHGTNEPFSIAEYDGAFMWINNQGHIVYFGDGQPEPISIGSLTNSQGLTTDVLDVIADIPSARRGKACAIVAKSRYYLFVNPTGVTTNSRCIVFNLLKRNWESIDTLTSCIKVARAYDSAQNGAGQRIIIYGSDGKAYVYEEGSGTVAFKLDTRDFLAQEVLGKAWTRGAGFTVKETEIACDAMSGQTITIDVYPDFVSGGSSYQFSHALDTQASKEWLVQGALVSGNAVAGRRAWFRIAGTITGGKEITGIMAWIEPTPGDLRAAG